MLTFKAHQKPICGLAFSPDGLTLATSARRIVEREEWITLWNLDGLTRVVEFPGGYSDPPIAFSPDGRFFATGDGSLDVYALDCWKAVFSTGTHADAIAFAPDGKEIATFGVDSLLVRWELPKRKNSPPSMCARITNAGGTIRYESSCPAAGAGSARTTTTNASRQERWPTRPMARPSRCATALTPARGLSHTCFCGTARRANSAKHSSRTSSSPTPRCSPTRPTGK